MAPEVRHRSHLKCDPSADIWSTAMVLFEMFTGHLPFKKNSYLEMLLAHLREPPRPPSSLVPMDPALENIILWALQKDPAHRPHSVRDLADHLLPYLKSKL